jgi:diguanylate cyclase (GGDEF)-like protein
MASTARIQRIRRREDPTTRDAKAPDGHEGDTILRHLTDFLNAFMWQADPATLAMSFVTASVREVLGYPASRWRGDPEHWSANILPQDRDRVVDSIRATGADGCDRRVEFHADHADGSTLLLRLAVRRVTSPSGEGELWGVITDITGDARAAESLRVAKERYRRLRSRAEALRRQTLEDSLTKLPNRLLFDDRADAVLCNAEREDGRFAMLVIDLDRFKEINDRYGHRTGDAALREVGLRIRMCLRAQDTPARIGGDEFAVLLPGVDEAGAARVASRIVRAMGSPFAAGGTGCALGVSIGIALYPRHGTSVEEMLGLADGAMYQVKAGGGGFGFASVQGTMPRPARRRRSRRWGLGRLAAGMVAVLTLVGDFLSLG